MGSAEVKSGFGFSVNGRALRSRDRVLTGRQIRSEAGFDPASEHVLILVVERGTRSIGLDETLELDADGGTKLRAFFGDRVFSFTLDERGYEWGAPTIAVDELRALAGVPEERELVLDADEDDVLEAGTELRLDRAGAERIRSRPVRARTVTIVVNGREKEVPRGRISHEQVLELAFGSCAPAVTHTVTWRDRGGDEGSLLPGESVRVREGMIFNATATNRS